MSKGFWSFAVGWNAGFLWSMLTAHVFGGLPVPGVALWAVMTGSFGVALFMWFAAGRSGSMTEPSEPTLSTEQ